jgi:hypothetical protein
MWSDFMPNDPRRREAVGDAQEDLIHELLDLEQAPKFLTCREMVENAFHEAGHTVVALRLGTGPLGSGIKLWSRPVRNSPSGTKLGETKVCLWTKSDQIVREEIERSIMVVLAGELAQHRLTPTFKLDGWSAHQSSYRAELKLDRWQADERLLHDLLRQLPLSAGQTAGHALASLTDRTQRLLDDVWKAVEAVARGVLKAKHHRLSGKQIAKSVNRALRTSYRHVSRCKYLKRFEKSRTLAGAQ